MKFFLTLRNSIAKVTPFRPFASPSRLQPLPGARLSIVCHFCEELLDYLMAPTTRRSGQAAAEASAGGEERGEESTKGRRRHHRSTTEPATTPTPTSPTATTTTLTAAEAADALDLEELGGIDPATSFLYTPHTLTGLVIGKRVFFLSLFFGRKPIFSLSLSFSSSFLSLSRL